MGWAAYAESRDLAIGSSVWLIGNEAASCPPTGGLPLLLGDDEVIKVNVVSTSPAAVVIEGDGCRLRLTPTAFGSANRASRHPGSEWVITSRLEGAASRALVMGPYSKVATVAAGVIIAAFVFKDTDFALALCRASFLATAIELLYFWGQRTIRK